MAVEAPSGAIPTIEAYYPLTRRKFTHAVYLDGDKPVFISQRLTDCIWWLDREGWSQYRLRSNKGTFLIVSVRERTS